MAGILRSRVLPIVVAGLVLAAGASGIAQRGRGAGPGTAPSARQSAPVDLTGYWVSVVSEDWRFRMMTPPKGDYGAVPLNPAGRKMADTWDPARDTANGNECRLYGAAGVMRVPGRLHITWQDDNTLKVDTDAGQQVRLFHFGPPPPETEPTWQGRSVASWDGLPAGEGRARWGSLRVVTTRLRPGYLRRNGVPYSEDTVLTEYYDRHALASGSEWFTVTTIVSDSRYLNQEFITSTDFKKEPDGSKWNPTPCETK